MSLEIIYLDAPDGAKENMTPEGDANIVSDIDLLRNGSKDIPWATLEPGQWVLDGTRKIMPDGEKVAFWSTERSGEDCTFAVPPILVLNFPLPYSATGLTISFSPSTDQWCSEIRVTWYVGQTLLIEKNYYPDKADWLLAESVDGFDRIDLEILSTNRPGQFAKINSISIGQNITFGPEEIESVRVSCESDHSLCTLPVDTAFLTIYDRHDRELLPQENQKIEIRKDGKLKSYQYITSSLREAKHRYSINCQSVIGLLNDDFFGGIYKNKPLEELVAEILGEWEYEIDPVFSGITVSGYLPVMSQKSALQQVSFAVGALVTTQETWKIRLMKIPEAVSGRFGASDIFLGGAVKTSPRIARVEVYSHSYETGDIEETLLREEEIHGENVLFTFAAPHHSYSIEGGVIEESHVNWVKISADGPITLKGITYIHNTKSHTRYNPSATAKERGNYVSVANATLITDQNAEAALDRLYKAKQNRSLTSQDVIVTGQKAGDTVSSLTPWGTITRGYISSMDSILTPNGHIATVFIQGVEIKLESAWMYSGEIYSGGMEVVY